MSHALMFTLLLLTPLVISALCFLCRLRGNAARALVTTVHFVGIVVLMVGMYRTHEALEAAWKYIIICTVGVAFGLFGTVLVYANAASFMVEPDHAIFWTEVLKESSNLDPTLMVLAFVFVLIGFGTKTGLFPMHAWLPDAHSEAPSPVSAGTK